MFSFLARTRPHPTKANGSLPDVDKLLSGENILHKTTVAAGYVKILDKVVDEAVAAGNLTREQATNGFWAGYQTDSGHLFLCCCATDGTGLVVGTTVPQGKWSFAQ